MRNLFAKAARLKALRGLRANLGRTMLSVGAAALVALSAWESREIMAVNRARGSSAQPSSGAEPAAAKDACPGAGNEFPRSLKAVVNPGSNVYSLLVKAGLAPTEVLRLIADFAQAADLTKCKPGEVLTIKQRPDGSIASVSYQKGPLEVFNAEKSTGSWMVRKENIPYTIRTEKIAGTILSSLFDAVSSKGEKDSLAANLIDLLAWEIDFAHESQPGDAFSVLVEKYHVDGRFVGYGNILAAQYAATGGTIKAFSLRNAEGKMEYFNETGQSMRKSFLRSPLRYSRITSGYTSRRLHPVTGRVQPHYAIDYGAPTGTPVWAVADGFVRGIGSDAASGRKIILSHPGGYESFYLHLSRYAKGLAVGQRVSQQQVIGYVGSTGLATGPHLDYRLNRHGSLVNPLRESFPRAEPVPGARMSEFLERAAWLGELMNGADAYTHLADSRR